MARNQLWSASILLSFCGCAVVDFSATRDFSRLEEVDGPVEVVVSSANGGITIRSHQSPVVLIDAKLTARAHSAERAKEFAEQMDPTFELSRDRLECKATHPAGAMGATTQFDILVPENSTVILKTSNGSIKVESILGSIQAESSNGGISIEHADGNVDARTSNGSIHLKHCQGRVQAKSSNGTIAMEDMEFEGDSKIQTSNGRIQVSLREAAATKIEATVSNGSVHCDLPFEGQKSKKRWSGIIHLDDRIPISKRNELPELNMSTSNGSIKID